MSTPKTASAPAPASQKPHEVPPPKAFEAPLPAESQGALRITGYPICTLSLKVDEKKSGRQGNVWMLVFKGTTDFLPDQTPCSVKCIRTPDGAKAEPFVAGTAPLKRSGDSCTLELALDIVERKLLGKGTLTTFTFEVLFPFAPKGSIEGSVRYSVPIDLEWDPKGEEVPFGQKFVFMPTVDKAYQKHTLRLTIQAAGASKAPLIYTKLVWETKSEEKETKFEEKEWRAGFATLDGDMLSGHVPPEAAPAALTFTLDLTDGKSTSHIWTKEACVKVARPKLEEFEVGHLTQSLYLLLGKLSQYPSRPDDSLAKEDHAKAIVAQGRVSGIAPDAPFPLELMLFGARLQATGSDSRSEVVGTTIDPLSKWVPAKVAPDGRFAALVWDPEAGRDPTSPAHIELYQHFALLRIPKAATATERPVVLSDVLDYDGKKFRPFDDDDLCLESEPAKGPKKAMRKGSTPFELGTSVASSNLEPDLLLWRQPNFGKLDFLVRREQLVIAVRQFGDQEYWNKAKTRLEYQAMADPAGKCTAAGEWTPLETKQSELHKRIQEAKPILLSDPKILGKTIAVRATVANPGTLFQGKTIDPPPSSIVYFDCTPRLGPVEAKIVSDSGDRFVFIACPTSYFPTGSDAKKSLRIRITEEIVPASHLIELCDPKVNYDLPVGSEGACDSRGMLTARIEDREVVSQLSKVVSQQTNGKYHIEVYRAAEKGMLYGKTVESATTTLGTTPRSVSGQLYWGKKVTKEFRQDVVTRARNLGIDANDLMTIMAVETARRFEPGIYPENRKAVGLIQFTQKAVEDLNDPKGDLTLAKLSGMSAVEQLKWVEKYFAKNIKRYSARKDDLIELYAVVFYPAAIEQRHSGGGIRITGDAYKSNESLDNDPGIPNQLRQGKKNYIDEEDLRVRLRYLESEGATKWICDVND